MKWQDGDWYLVKKAANNPYNLVQPKTFLLSSRTPCMHMIEVTVDLKRPGLRL